MIYFNIILSILFAVLRIIGIKSQLYQAFVHLFTGYLFGVWFGKKQLVNLIIFILLLTVEILCFFMI